MGEIGTLSGSPGDQEVTRGAINDITADFTPGGKTSVCHTGLAYRQCADTSWMVTYDMDTTCAWFYSRYFRDTPVSEMQNRYKLDEFTIEDIRRKYAIGRAVSVPFFIDRLAPYKDQFPAIASSALHEFSCTGDLLKRTVILKQDGSRLISERLAVANDSLLYVMSKLSTSKCWKVTLRRNTSSRGDPPLRTRDSLCRIYKKTRPS